jgi:hypothetical protein
MFYGQKCAFCACLMAEVTMLPRQKLTRIINPVGSIAFSINHRAAFLDQRPSSSYFYATQNFFPFLGLLFFAFEFTIEIHTDKFFQWQTNFPLDEPHKNGKKKSILY